MAAKLIALSSTQICDLAAPLLREDNISVVVKSEGFQYKVTLLHHNKSCRASPRHKGHREPGNLKFLSLPGTCQGGSGRPVQFTLACFIGSFENRDRKKLRIKIQTMLPNGEQ